MRRKEPDLCNVSKSPPVSLPCVEQRKQMKNQSKHRSEGTVDLGNSGRQRAVNEMRK
jgi:hypothetical protein